MSGITVVIPTIEPRRRLLQRAVDSVESQTFHAEALIVEEDRWKSGAAKTRQEGLLKVETEWVAFLDDDDWLYPDHLYSLLLWAELRQADYVYSWYDTCGNDPFPDVENQEFDPEHPQQTTVTTLVRTELAKKVGFLGSTAPPTPTGHRAGEDWAFTQGCINEGAVIRHLAKRTWHWCHGQCEVARNNRHANTMGLPGRW